MDGRWVGCVDVMRSEEEGVLGCGVGRWMWVGRMEGTVGAFADLFQLLVFTHLTLGLGVRAGGLPEGGGGHRERGRGGKEGRGEGERGLREE